MLLAFSHVTIVWPWVELDVTGVMAEVGRGVLAVVGGVTEGCTGTGNMRQNGVPGVMETAEGGRTLLLSEHLCFHEAFTKEAIMRILLP